MSKVILYLPEELDEADLVKVPEKDLTLKSSIHTVLARKLAPSRFVFKKALRWNEEGPLEPKEEGEIILKGKILDEIICLPEFIRSFG
jgi:hypothetical protein